MKIHNIYKKIIHRVQERFRSLWNKISVLKAKWWEILLALLFIFTTVIVFTPYTQILKDWADLLKTVLTPVTIILGIILGYPLLRKRLTEQHVLKQFEIMTSANRNVRHKIIELSDKYQPEKITTDLDLNYVNKVLEDVITLKQCALDATPDVYRYANLVFKTLNNLSSIYSSYSDSHYPILINKRNLQIWLLKQLREIFDFSKSIGVISSGKAVEKNVVNSSLSPFVTHNSIYEIKDIAHCIQYYHSDAMLVLFFGTTNETLTEDCIPVFKSTYDACPTPAPYARLLWLNSIYFPPQIISKESLMLLRGHFQLIGFRRKVTSSSGGVEKRYYICIYSDVIDNGFLDYTLNAISKLSEYSDGYLETDIDIHRFDSFKQIDARTFTVQISVENAHDYFNAVKPTLEAKLLSEKK